MEYISKKKTVHVSFMFRKNNIDFTVILYVEECILLVMFLSGMGHLWMLM